MGAVDLAGVVDVVGFAAAAEDAEVVCFDCVVGVFDDVELVFVLLPPFAIDTIIISATNASITVLNLWFTNQPLVPNLSLLFITSSP